MFRCFDILPFPLLGRLPVDEPFSAVWASDGHPKQESDQKCLFPSQTERQSKQHPVASNCLLSYFSPPEDAAKTVVFWSVGRRSIWISANGLKCLGPKDQNDITNILAEVLPKHPSHSPTQDVHERNQNESKWINLPTQKQLGLFNMYSSYSPRIRHVFATYSTYSHSTRIWTRCDLFGLSAAPLLFLDLLGVRRGSGSGCQSPRCFDLPELSGAAGGKDGRKDRYWKILT